MFPEHLNYLLMSEFIMRLISLFEFLKVFELYLVQLPFGFLSAVQSIFEFFTHPLPHFFLSSDFLLRHLHH